MTQPGVALDLRTRLDAVIAMAAPAPERAASEYFVPCAASNTRDLGPRVRRWIRTAVQDDEALRAMMKHLAVHGRTLGAELRTVRLRDPKKPPPWAEFLVAFLESQPASLADADSIRMPTTLLASFERSAHALMPRHDGRIEDVEVADTGHQGIVAELVRRLIEVCDAGIRFELQLTMPDARSVDWLQMEDIDGTQAGWLERFERLPVLAFLVAITCEQWQRNVTEILRRLRTDTDLLRAEPFKWDGQYPLIEFKGGAGDRHAEGRSVTLLRFESGRGLVYKPKDLRHVEATMNLIMFLNSGGLSLPLATRGVMCRHGYGWEERVDPSPVAESHCFHLFYRRLGMLMRLMQLLNGRDLWADNLLASGDHPHLIDLECLFSPPLYLSSQLPSRHRAYIDRIETTVVRTGMALQPWLPSPDCPNRDLGCLSHISEQLEAGRTGISLAPYRPWTATKTADPWDHAGDVTAGYREMHQVLVANREELLLDDSPLAAFAGVCMRYIWRATPDCHNIVRASMSPLALVDGSARETVLASVLRGAFTPVGRDVHMPEIASAEIDAFRRLDVPLFTTQTNSSSLFSPNGTEITGYFPGTAWDEVRRRIAALDQQSLEADVAILEAAVDAARGGTDMRFGAEPAASPAPTTSHRARLEDNDPTVDEVVEAIDMIAELLLEARCPPLGTGFGWLALLWSPLPDLWEVGPAGADLISGGLGPALFLADHFSFSGNARSWTASREDLDGILAHATSNENLARDPRLPLGGAAAGGLAGAGALVYVTARVAASLGDSSLLLASRAQAERAAAQPETVGFDLSFGLAGLQLAMLDLRSHGVITDAELHLFASDTARRLERVIANPDTSQDRGLVATRLRDLVPCELDGVSLALARTVAIAPALLGDRSMVMASLAGHSFELARRGGRLAALAVHACGTPVDVLPTDLRHGVADRSQLSTRELVTRAEEAQLAARSGDAGAAAEARSCIRVLLDRRALTGQWFPDRLVDDRLNLSALDGLPALGSVLIRYIRPELPLVSVLE